MAAIGNYLIGSINPSKTDPVQDTGYTVSSSAPHSPACRRQEINKVSRPAGGIPDLILECYPAIGSTCMFTENNTDLPLIYIHISTFFCCSAQILDYSAAHLSKRRFFREWRWQQSYTSTHQLLIGGYPGVVCVPLGQLNNLSIC